MKESITVNDVLKKASHCVIRPSRFPVGSFLGFRDAMRAKEKSIEELSMLFPRQQRRDPEVPAFNLHDHYFHRCRISGRQFSSSPRKDE